MSDQCYVDDSNAVEHFAAKHMAPFRRICGKVDCYERTKMVVLFPLMLLRLLGIILALVCGTSLVILTFCGINLANYTNKPLPKHRRRISLFIVRVFVRLLLLCMGVYRIEVNGVALSKSTSVLVCNHVSYLDILTLLVAFDSTPSFLALDDVRKRTFVGTVCTALQSVYVKAGDGQGTTPLLLERINLSKEFPGLISPLVIFPEGTTTNGHYLAAFRSGAFIGNHEVQPILLQYPYRHFNPSWETIPLWYHMFRLHTQFINRVSVTLLPPMAPSISSQSPRLFADAVQAQMAADLGIPFGHHSRKHKLVLHRLIRGLISIDEAERHVQELNEQQRDKLIFSTTEEDFTLFVDSALP